MKFYKSIVIAGILLTGMITVSYRNAALMSEPSRLCDVNEAIAQKLNQKSTFPWVMFDSNGIILGKARRQDSGEKHITHLNTLLAKKR